MENKCKQVKMYNLKKTVMNIIGRMTRDAEVCTLSNKKQVVNFSIATNDNYRNKQGENKNHQKTTKTMDYHFKSIAIINILKILSWHIV